MNIDIKPLMRTVPTVQALALAKKNADFALKKKKNVKDYIVNLKGLNLLKK